MSGYRSGVTAGRLVTKRNVAGQTSLGQAALSGATTGTPTAWGEITASLAADTVITQVLAFCATTVSGSTYSYLEVGVGGAGSESVVAQVFLPEVAAGNSFRAVVSLPIPCRVGAGSRLSVRFTSGNNFSGSTVTAWLAGMPYVNVEGA